MATSTYVCWECGAAIPPPTEKHDVLCSLCLSLRIFDIEAEIREQSRKEPPTRRS
jgi:DNA-directed RNA polymerase subunit RPC12/RpoP